MKTTYAPGDVIVKRSPTGEITRRYVVADPPLTAKGKLRMVNENGGITSNWWNDWLPPDYSLELKLVSGVDGDPSWDTREPVDKPKLVYRDEFKVDQHLTVADILGIQEFLTGVGYVLPSKSMDVIRFELEVEGDLWDLRERVDEIEIELSSRGVVYRGSKLMVCEAPEHD